MPPPKQVLIVEDDAAIRSMLQDLLRESGYAVDSACNGLQALTAFWRHRPEVLVLDLAMPVMDGPTWVAPCVIRRGEGACRWRSSLGSPSHSC